MTPLDRYRTATAAQTAHEAAALQAGLERRRAVLELSEGRTMQQLGEVLGLTRARAHRMLSEARKLEVG